MRTRPGNPEINGVGFLLRRCPQICLSSVNNSAPHGCRQSFGACCRYGVATLLPAKLRFEVDVVAETAAPGAAYLLPDTTELLEDLRFCVDVKGPAVLVV